MAKKASPFTGRWHIVSMSAWDDEALNKEVQAFIEFDQECLGKFRFGYVRGVTDHYRTKKRGRMRMAQFSWHGEDGADGSPLDGIGWVILEGGELTGTIRIDQGDDSEFVARRATETMAKASEGHRAKEHPRLKLGKRASFVKSRLKQLPQLEETWEADFRAMPKSEGESETHYLGLVVVLSKGDPLIYMPVEYTPTVNDLADLLADAMRRPLTGSARRPARIHFRGNPRWDELFPHLKALGIEAILHDELAELEEVCLDFLRQMRKASPSPIIMLSHRSTSVDRQFPAIGEWVQESGWIEVGRRKAVGFVARALDDGGLVVESTICNTLTEALTALDEGLREWFNDRGTSTEAVSLVQRAGRSSDPGHR